MDPRDRRRIGSSSAEGEAGRARLESDDAKLLVAEGLSPTSRLWIVDVASGQKTLLTPKEGEPASYTGAVFADGKASTRARTWARSSTG